jgi:predicted N-acetyltransferase YhbS
LLGVLQHSLGGGRKRATPEDRSGMVEYRTLREREREAFLDLMEAAFVDEQRAHFARYLDHDPRLGCDDTLVALDAGRIVAAVQIFTRQIRLRGEAVLLGGIGSVGTHPEFERRGLSTALLRRAIDEMGDRGMALSLLFTGRTSFYQRLDWVQIPHPLLVVRRRAGPCANPGRSFRDSDLPAVRRLYDAYSGSRDGVTVRDDIYWRAQLRFAGQLDEHFVVLERDGAIVAYARRIRFLTLARIIEHGCVSGREGDLAELLLSLAPADAPLFLPHCDAVLESALGARADSCEQIAFPDQMWRVLDRSRLLALADADATIDDAALLAALVSGPDRVYWPSDRF